MSKQDGGAEVVPVGEGGEGEEETVDCGGGDGDGEARGCAGEVGEAGRDVAVDVEV